MHQLHPSRHLQFYLGDGYTGESPGHSIIVRPCIKGDRKNGRIHTAERQQLSVGLGNARAGCGSQKRVRANFCIHHLWHLKPFLKQEEGAYGSALFVHSFLKSKGFCLQLCWYVVLSDFSWSQSFSFTHISWIFVFSYRSGCIYFFDMCLASWFPLNPEGVSWFLVSARGCEKKKEARGCVLVFKYCHRWWEGEGIQRMCPVLFVCYLSIHACGCRLGQMRIWTNLRCTMSAVGYVLWLCFYRVGSCEKIVILSFQEAPDL